MFGAFFDLLMVPVNFVRKTFGWMPDEAEGDGDGATTKSSGSSPRAIGASG